MLQTIPSFINTGFIEPVIRTQIDHALTCLQKFSDEIHRFRMRQSKKYNVARGNCLVDVELFTDEFGPSPKVWPDILKRPYRILSCRIGHPYVGMTQKDVDCHLA